MHNPTFDFQDKYRLCIFRISYQKWFGTVYAIYSNQPSPLFNLLPSIEVDQTVFARIIAGLKEVKEYLIVLVAGCAIALGVVFITRKEEAF